MQPPAQQKFPKEQIVIFFFFFLEGKWKTFEVKRSWGA